jgi:hypothetical protein
MRWLILCLGLWGVLPVQAEGIVEVLQRSQQQRLEQRGTADEHSAPAQRLRASFERLTALSPPSQRAELVLVGGGLFAEALFGRQAVAASAAVGDLPEGERLLLLSHELGHLALGHWAALSGLYLKHIPGEVRPESTEPVAAVLGAQAHALSHRQEFEADAHGFRMVRQLGFGVDNALSLLTREGMRPDTATHPATRRRLAQIRLLDTEPANAPLADGDTTAVAGAPHLPAH